MRKYKISDVTDVTLLSKKLKKELDLEEEKEYLLFEWDPDYMILQENWEVLEHIYFTSYEWKIITDWYSEDEEKLVEFFNWSEKRKPFEEQNWWTFQEYNWLKIAYRWGVGYVYSLYYYVD